MQSDLSIIVGAERTNEYLSIIEGKRIALVANQSSRVGESHLLDTLLELGIDIKKIFTPEHGFRGKEDAGAKVQSDIDSKTGIPLISLYGNNKKPNEAQLKDIDLIIFDLQDVGVRFYTYLSTLHYIMQAATEQGISVVVLDRPNPHMDVVDGPLMEEDFMSFVGLHPVPLMYGMSIGEYAQMINIEKWLGTEEICQLTVVQCQNLKRDSHYNLPIPPSPNLPNMKSIDWYPSLALFEGTVISVGRGTALPFQQIGHPEFSSKYSHSFIPEPTEGAKNPKLKGKKCYGYQLDQEDFLSGGIELKFLIEFYSNYSKKDSFFNSFFDLLAGTDELKKQIESSLSEDEIKESWQKDLEAFMQIRKKYLIYK